MVVTIILICMALRYHCSRLSGFPQMYRTAKRAWHPGREAMEYGETGEVVASEKPLLPTIRAKNFWSCKYIFILSFSYIQRCNQGPSTSGVGYNIWIIATDVQGTRYKVFLLRAIYSCVYTITMNFSKDSLDDEILLQADGPAVNNASHSLPICEPPASGLEPAPSPTSNLPNGDLALEFHPQERGKGKPCTANWLSQEPGDSPIPTSTEAPAISWRRRWLNAQEANNHVNVGSTLRW